MTATIETHPFEPFVPANSTVLILGSFPGKKHKNDLMEGQWFYGAKRNQFWRILSAVYDVELIDASIKKQLFTEKGIAIADIFLKVYRKENNNLDSNLQVVEYNDKAIELILQTINFTHIFFTSKFVEKHFKKLFPEVTNGECLPSPSPRFARMTIEKKIAYYKCRLPR